MTAHQAVKRLHFNIRDAICMRAYKKNYLLMTYLLGREKKTFFRARGDTDRINRRYIKSVFTKIVGESLVHPVMSKRAKVIVVEYIKMQKYYARFIEKTLQRIVASMRKVRFVQAMYRFRGH